MKDILAEAFGSRMESYRKKKASLPLYLSEGRSFYDVSVCGKEFVLVCVGKERFNISALKKQEAKYRDAFGADVAYGFPSLTYAQRKALVESGSAFSSGNGQVFLPFIGTYFTRCVKKDAVLDGVRLMPASQMLFLLMLYGEEHRWYSRSEAAGILSVTPMSVTRAAGQLKAVGVLEEEKRGTEVLMSLSLGRAAAFGAMEPYLINPVQEEVFVRGEVPGFCPRAGEFSLSKRTEYGYPRCAEYALPKSDARLERLECVAPELSDETGYVKLQKWRYDPALFSDGADVDPVSLLCSFAGAEDERIHKCLMTVKGEIGGWRITKN